VRFSFVYGLKYRARVAMPLALQRMVPPQSIAAELQRYQLFGTVTPHGLEYVLEAQFRGRSGTYDLPEQVQSCEVIGQ